MSEELKDQIDRLADYIMANIPGEPSQSEGAIDCSIRIMTNQQSEINALRKQLEEIEEKLKQIKELAMILIMKRMAILTKLRLLPALPLPKSSALKRRCKMRLIKCSVIFSLVIVMALMIGYFAEPVEYDQSWVPTDATNRTPFPTPIPTDATIPTYTPIPIDLTIPLIDMVKYTPQP